MSASAWQAMVSSALGISASSVTVRNITDPNGQCIGQSTKRQAEVSGTEILFTLQSVPTSGSQGLASKFISLAQSMDPSLAESGGVKSVAQVPPQSVAENVPFGTQDPSAGESLPVEGGGGGLGVGAIAGIVVGSFVGVGIVIAIVGAAIAGGVVFAVYKYKHRKPSAIWEDTEKGSHINSGIDIYSPKTSHKSITARMPSSDIAYNL